MDKCNLLVINLFVNNIDNRVNQANCHNFLYTGNVGNESNRGNVSN
jgi:hypothetical protein